MTDARDDLTRALREVGEELGKGLESLSRMAKQAGADLGRFGAPVPGAPPGSPIRSIRELAALRDEGYITEQEYQAKKAELLRRI